MLFFTIRSLKDSKKYYNIFLRKGGRVTYIVRFLNTEDDGPVQNVNVDNRVTLMLKSKIKKQ